MLETLGALEKTGGPHAFVNISPTCRSTSGACACGKCVFGRSLHLFARRWRLAPPVVTAMRRCGGAASE